MIGVPYWRHRDHNNERPLDPPTPVVQLVPPHVERTDPELPEPDLRYGPLRDHETLALEAALAMTPMRAYWAALTWGPAYAASWSAWVRLRHQREWLLYLEERER